MANGDDRKLVPDPDEDALERGRRNLMLRNAALASRPAYTPGELTRPAMPEAPDLVPAPPTEAPITPTAGPPPATTLAHRLEAREHTLEGQLPSWGEQNWKQRLGTIAQTAGNVLIPKVMMNIPGTIINRRLELENVRKALGEEQEREGIGEYRKAQLPKIGAETERDYAEAARARAEAAERGGPKEITGPRGTATNPVTGEQLVGYEYRGPGGTLQSTYVAPGETPPTTLTPAEPQRAGIPGVTPPMGMPTVAPPARPSGLPPGFMIGPQTAESDRQTFLRLFNKKDRTPQEEQYVQGHLPEYETVVPVGKEKADQMMAEMAKMPGIDPGIYAIAPGTSLRDANGLMTAARQASELNRQYKAPEEAQRRKDEREMGYAMNPTNNKLEYMSRAQSEDYRSLFEPVKNTQTDRVSIRQLNDIQKNMGEFRNAILAPTGNIEHTSAMRRIMAGVNPSDVEKMGFITMGAAMQMMEQGEVTKAWQELDDKEKKLMVGYLRAKGAMIAYNRVIAGSARQNKEALAVDWQNLPTPDMGAAVAMPLMDAVQENLDQVEAGFPTNLPGLKDPFTTKREVQEKGERERGPAAAGPKNFDEWKAQQRKP